eukprot:478028-Rhodomonas_salina.3
MFVLPKEKKFTNIEIIKLGKFPYISVAWCGHGPSTAPQPFNGTQRSTTSTVPVNFHLEFLPGLPTGRNSLTSWSQYMYPGTRVPG